MEQAKRLVSEPEALSANEPHTRNQIVYLKSNINISIAWHFINIFICADISPFIVLHKGAILLNQKSYMPRINFTRKVSSFPFKSPCLERNELVKRCVTL